MQDEALKDILYNSTTELSTNVSHNCFQTHSDNIIVGIVIVDTILSVASITGNLLVIISVAKFYHLRTVTNVFVVGLAAADLLVGLNVPYYVIFYFKYELLSCHRILCLLRYWFTIFTTGCSMLCSSGVAVDRYVAVCYPLSYHRVIRANIAAWFVVAVWTFMGAVSSLPFLGIGDSFDPNKECDLYYTHTKTYALLAVAALVLITFIVTTILYTFIFKKAWEQRQAIAAIKPKNQGIAKETKTANTMALVFGVNFLGFLPYLGVVSLRYINGVDQKKIGFLKPFVVCFYFGKSALNPVIYGWKNKEFRNAFQKLLSYGKH